MPPSEPRTIYEQLTGVKVDNATIEQLDFTRNTFIDEKSIEYWKGVITISKILEASRTYPGGGMPIPESGAVGLGICNPGETLDIQPPGTEVWRLTGLWLAGEGGTATMNISYYDGALEQLVKSAVSAVTGGVIVGAYGAVSDVEVTALPIELTNALYFRFEETGSTNPCNIRYSYHKVSL